MRHEIIALKDHFPFLGNDGCDPTLTVYLPDNLPEIGRENEMRPGVLICPGGGYGYCSSREAEPVALHFLTEGLHAFVLNYSCDPHRFPTQLIEVAAAMELICRNAELWHCDADRIAIMGFSAGGHLAAHYSTAYDCPEVRAVFPRSRAVQASVLCYPVITADPHWCHAGSFCALIGTEERTQAEIDKFSCDRLVSAHTPPAFLWHTAEDGCVPVMNSLLYTQALAAHGVPFELHVFPRGGHGLSTCDRRVLNDHQEAYEYDRVWMDYLKKWLRQLFSLS